MAMSKNLMGSNHQSTKIQNRALVLKLICTGTNVSRIDLSKLTGLSKMSITNIVSELINEGYVMEQGESTEQVSSSSVGRKPVFLLPSTRLYSALGVYISRDFVVVTLVNIKCEILFEERCNLSFEESRQAFVEKICLLVKNILDKAASIGRKVLGIGIACIGPLDVKNGIILEPTNFHKLSGIPLKDLLEKEFHYKVWMDKDTNAAALAEKLYGNAKTTRNFVYLGVTNGIGAGIISNDALFSGDMGFGGEIGHTTINFEGSRCACGNNGCLELYASIPEIVAQARNSVRLGMDSALKELDGIEWKDIVNYAQRGDKLAFNLIDRMCMYISIGLVSLINIFDPEIVYLGHDFSYAGSLVTERLEIYIQDKTISRRYKAVPIRISAFGENSPITGSAAIVFDKLFSGAAM